MNGVSKMNRRNGGLMITSAALGIASFLLPSGALAGHRVVGLAGVYSPERGFQAYQTLPRPVTVLRGCLERPRKVWREPVYELRQVQVEIPPVVVSERIPRYNWRGEVVGYDVIERVIERARRAWKNERVLIQPGYWEMIVDRSCGRLRHSRGAHNDMLFRPAHLAGRRHLKIHKSRPRHRLVWRRRPR